MAEETRRPSKRAAAATPATGPGRQEEVADEDALYDQLREVLPSSGLLHYSLDTPSVLCKPKIMAMKSYTLQRMEEIQEQAQETLRQQEMEEQARQEEATALEAAAAAREAAEAATDAKASMDAASEASSSAGDAVAALLSAAGTSSVRDREDVNSPEQPVPSAPPAPE
ncbi:BBSome-interacting protein 1-like [Sycon ciliatum]|uniref:BBSome-interacting protein 1-like n=1 Tax=Sycon ciliatum TaxID=27933 RepID=UPI0031F6AF3E